jgi:predicted metalloprotease with PDZ domain
MNPSASIHYRIVPSDPQAHLFRVVLTIPAPAPSGQVVTMPAWIPGSYMIRDYARHVIRLQARCGNEPVAVEKRDKDSWACAPCEGPLQLEYEVYAWDLSVRGAHLDTGHGYFNGTCVFLQVEGQQDHPCRVEILPPEGGAYHDWRVATTLQPDTAQPYGFGGYRADDYDELVDHPVEMGRFDLVSFEACGVPHDVVLTGRHHADLDRLARDLKPLCEQHIRFFGEPPPVSRYLFQVMVTGDGYGGLEHRASTSLITSRGDLPRPGRDEVDDGYRRFLGLCSHEYFHIWNVKRIKPAAFTPYDYQRENYTRLLWAFEGITSYYDDLALVRSGLIDRDSYLELLGRTITRVRRGSGRLKQSVAESSFEAWTKFYKQDENAPNAIVSYYAKGALVALALDLTIRRGSGGKKSLDDVMAALWRRHGQTGQGVPEDGVERIAAEVSGLDLDGFFDQALRSTDELPLAELLPWVGLELKWRRAESADDQGGKPPTEDGARVRPWLGARLTDGNGGARLSQVFDGGPAQAAGLSAGDVIFACDGLRVSGKELDGRLRAYPVGTRVRIHAFRRDELLEVDLELTAAPADTAWLAPLEGDEEAARRRKDWLGTE